jgi:DNA (cytosine-5)-methyltransferase 1
MKTYTSIEVCAGAGGQALGIERAGFQHRVLIDNDPDCVATLRLNRLDWNVRRRDINKINAQRYAGVDLLAGALPCPPLNAAGQQLGEADERHLLPGMLRLVDQVQPKAVMLETVPGLLAPRFAAYRDGLSKEFESRGYVTHIKLFNAADFGVPQSRRRIVIVALKAKYAKCFKWPQERSVEIRNVGDVLFDLMREDGWKGAEMWRAAANSPAPVLVGGSKKLGGADLGPSRSRAAWAKLGVNGLSLADAPPAEDYMGMPRLTLKMVKRLQGLPDVWEVTGGKTAAYRQLANAFSPDVAYAIAKRIRKAIKKTDAKHWLKAATSTLQHRRRAISRSVR